MPSSTHIPQKTASLAGHVAGDEDVGVGQDSLWVTQHQALKPQDVQDLDVIMATAHQIAEQFCLVLITCACLDIFSISKNPDNCIVNHSKSGYITCKINNQKEEREKSCFTPVVIRFSIFTCLVIIFIFCYLFKL